MSQDFLAVLNVSDMASLDSHVRGDYQPVYKVVGRFKNSFNWAVGATALLTDCIE